MRLLKYYDSSLYKQVHTLIPARANATVGILVEPTVLERDKVIIGKNKTTIISGGGKSPQVKERVKILRGQLKLAKSKWDREKIEKRIGRLSGGVAVLEIGAATETEMKEKKSRIQDMDC